MCVIQDGKIARLARECVGIHVGEAKLLLAGLPQKAANELYKTIHSAASNCLTKTPNVNIDELIIKSILVDGGPSMKRMMPRARGRSDRIIKRSSHIKVLVVDKIKKVEEPKDKNPVVKSKVEAKPVIKKDNKAPKEPEVSTSKQQQTQTKRTTKEKESSDGTKDQS